MITDKPMTEQQIFLMMYRDFTHACRMIDVRANDVHNIYRKGMIYKRLNRRR